MLRSLQFHEYEMIIAIVFLHYPDLQNRQLPPGMWFFTLAMTWHKVTKSLACLPAPQADMCARHWEGQKGRERNATSSHSPQEEAP